MCIDVRKLNRIYLVGMILSKSMCLLDWFLVIKLVKILFWYSCIWYRLLVFSVVVVLWILGLFLRVREFIFLFCLV